MTIREHRKHQHLTLHQLSALSGVSVTQIQAVETGKSDPGNMSARNFLAIAKALNANPWELIDTPPNEWGSVEDTVPDPGERVLATDGIFVGEAYRSSANSWFRHTGFPWRDGVTGRTVRFWMPLPTPPNCRPPEGEEDT